MPSNLLHDVRRFLLALEKVQEELGELFIHKRQALLHADTEAMARLTEAEAKTGERMQALLRFRAQLLNAAKVEGHGVESLADLIPRIAGAETDALMQQVARGEASAGRLRHESWVLWIIVDAFAIGLYLWRGLNVTSGLYALFFILAVVGLREWARKAKA